MDYKKIKTLKTVLKVHGLTDADLESVKKSLTQISKKVPLLMRDKYVAREFASYILGVWVSAINGDWVPDLEDLTQRKYYNWFWRIKKEWGSSACGLSLYAVLYDVAAAYVAPHLYLESMEKAAHAAKYALECYENYYIGEA